MFKRRSHSKVSHKVRELYPDLGCMPVKDTLYRAYSGYHYTTSETYQPLLNEDTYLGFWKQSYLMRGTNITVGQVLGQEEITSVNGGRSSMHACTHRKLNMVNYPHATHSERYNRPGALYYTHYWRTKPSSGYALYLVNVLDGYLKRYSVGNDSGFSGRAFWSMRPTFEGQVSLINSIFELKDFRDVVNLPKLYKRLQNILNSPLIRSINRSDLRAKERYLARTRARLVYGNTDKATMKALTRDLSGSAAAAVLTMNLAIKPTISDFMSISAQLLQSASDAQSIFGLYGGLGSTSHFSEVDVEHKLTLGSGNYYYLATGTHHKVKRTATMRSFYDYQMRPYNEALRLYWGLTGTTEALWNMLPLSFVLDYIFTVGKALEAMKRDDNVTNLRTEYCESIKIELTDGTHIALTPRMHSSIINGRFFKRPNFGSETYHLVSGTQCTRYTRKPMEPYKGPALPKFKKPSANQAVNILALARVFLF